MKIIPYGHQSIDRHDIKQVIAVLKSDWITQGPKIKEFEDDLCRYTGARFCLAVSSGTAALHVACLAAGVQRGDEVITTPITFAASANCALYCGGKPVFADVQKDTINIDPFAISKKINTKTKVLIPVHFAGYPCDLKEINRIAKKNNLIVIEDAAHALGATYQNKKIGSCTYSDMTVLSFHPVKTITTGEGGAVLTNSKSLYEKLVMFRNHGITKSNFKRAPEGEWYHEMRCLGYNYRITDFQAALGISQLRKVDSFIKARQSIADIYKKAFSGNPYFDLLSEPRGAQSSHHLFAILLKDHYKRERKQIFANLRKNGLGVQVHYIPVYFHPYYQQLGFKRGICPVAEDFYQREISIPIYQSMSKAAMQSVIKKVLKVFTGYR